MLCGERRRPWRFEARWIRREECEGIIREGWQEHQGADIFERIACGVEGCQLGLSQMIKSAGPSPGKKIRELRERLATLEDGVLTPEKKDEMAGLKVELEHLYMDEEIYWRQRCKNQWAKEDDRSTRFFHAKATKRRKNNTISGLENPDGEWRDTVAEVEKIILDYFGDLFTSTNPSLEFIDDNLANVSPRVTLAMNQQLAMHYSPSEVTSAHSQMSPLKSPGPDGLPPIFFQKYWNILGSDITSCVLNFLNNKCLPRMLYFTFIVLIPKVNSPRKISEFKPISLCNVVYKIGSKMIANRLKPFMNDIISPFPISFCP